MKKYLLKGVKFVGGNDFSSSSKQWNAVEHEFLANNDNHARIRARQFTDVKSPSLFVQIDLDEKVLAAGASITNSH